MKKIMSSLLVVTLLLAGVFMTSCSGKENGETPPPTGDSGKGIPASVSMRDIFVEVNDLFEYPAVAMGSPIDEQILADVFEIPVNKTTDYAGEMSMSMTNSDVFLGVRAAKGEIEAVTTALETRLKDLQAQYAQYPVSGSKERADVGEVYVVGDCAFLIVIGVIPDGMGDGPYDFSGDVKKVKETIDGFAK